MYIVGGYTSTYCKDKYPTICALVLQYVYKGDIAEFEEEYCDREREHEINCLKTCRRCL